MARRLARREKEDRAADSLGAVPMPQPPAAPPLHLVEAPALHLVEALSPRTWRAVVGDPGGERPVAARWLASVGSRATPVLTSPPVVPWLMPALGLARTERAHWLLSELDEGIDLRRLLALARLTPLQAAAVLDDSAAALAELHRRGRWHGRVHAGNVQVGLGGLIRVTDWGPAWLQPGTLDGHRAVDLAALTGLAGELAAQVTPQRGGSRQAQLYDDLRRRADRSLPRPDAEADPTAWLLDEHEHARARAELATVTQALRRSRRTTAPAPRVPAQRQPEDPPATRPPAPVVPLVSTGPPLLPKPTAPRRTLARRTGVILSLLLVAAVAAELVVLGPGIRADWRRLTTGPTAPATPARGAAGPDGGAPLPRLGPPAAGAVTGVALRPLTTCVPGQVCDVRVLVRVWPNDTRRVPVAWRMVVVDRCTGVRVERPGGAVVVPVGADRVDGLSHVLLPRTGALALAAVTVEPATAASPSIAVPATGTSC
jgi:hypothetical protein